MITILLIACPAILLFTVLSGRTLSGRKPAWRVVNISTSLLLLFYFLAASGLGIFWVSRQELPVFDLHYLLGYITCLLVFVHVYLNRAAIRLKPRVAQKDKPAPAKTPWIGRLKGNAPMVAIAGIICFWIGTELNPNSIFVFQQAAGATQTASAPGKLQSAPPVARQMIGSEGRRIPLAVYYHNTTKNTRWNIIKNRKGLDWSQCPEVFKPYPSVSSLSLPAPDLNQPDKTGEVIERQKRNASAFDSGHMTAEELSSILMLNNGITGTLEYPGVKYYLRSAPSAGALYPAITYVLINTVVGMEQGLYHYNVKKHQLDPIVTAPGLEKKLRTAVAMPSLMDHADVVLIYTANFYRSCWKYGQRAYRYILLDTGHVVQNALLGAETFGYQGNPIGEFDDQRVNTLLQIDDNEEGALLLLPLGKGRPAAPIALKNAFKAAPQPLSGKADDLVLFTHGQTCLQRDDFLPAASLTADNKLYEKSYPAQPVVTLPDSYDTGSTLTTTIMNRRSVRSWAETPMSLNQLSSLLYYSFGVKNKNGICLADPGVSGSRFLNLYLIITRVDGIAPGVYYYNRRRHTLCQIQAGDVHKKACEAALSQEVVSRADVCFVLTTSNALLNSHPAGDRSLRYAGIEAGMIGENIYLQAEALGLGCTGIGAYFDDELSDLIQVAPAEEAITYLLATGVKKKAP